MKSNWNSLNKKQKKLEAEFDADGKSKKGEPCDVCFGTGSKYCCDTWEYAMSDRNEPIDWKHLLPHFPGTSLEINFCPFCGREFDRLAVRLGQ